MDYYSRHLELNATTSASVITSLKDIFSHHGIPAVLVSDNGPQFDSKDTGSKFKVGGQFSN